MYAALTVAMLSYMLIVNHSIAPHFNYTHSSVCKCSSCRLISSTYFIYTQSIVVVTRLHKQLATTSRHPSPSSPQQVPWLPLFPVYCCEPRTTKLVVLIFVHLLLPPALVLQKAINSFSICSACGHALSCSTSLRSALNC
jgi:hypothetical protein